VDPDHRQDSPGALTLAQSFLARRAVRHGEGTDDLADTDGDRTFQIDLDFIDHALRVSTSDGAQRQFACPDNRW